MSGGVDSTLVTMMLLEKGCKVIGVTMSLWDGKIPQGVDVENLKSSCYSPSETKNIEEIIFPKFENDSIKTMEKMFYNCNNLKEIIDELSSCFVNNFITKMLICQGIGGKN